MRVVATLAGLALMGGCVAVTEPATDPQDVCGASGYQSLVGANIAVVSLPADLNDRVIRPGDAVTMDFNPERINFRLDDTGRIIAIDCG